MILIKTTPFLNVILLFLQIIYRNFDGVLGDDGTA